MPRLTALLALLVAAAAISGCNDAGGEVCPGSPVATFQFTLARICDSDPRLAGLEPAAGVPDCPATAGAVICPSESGTEPAYPQVPDPFAGTLAATAGSSAAALCRSKGAILFGAHTGTRYVVQTGTSGAVLGGCDPSCSTGLELVVAGDVELGPVGEAVAFHGVLVEVMSPLQGSSCGACVLPCAGRYALDGAPVASGP